MPVCVGVILHGVHMGGKLEERSLVKETICARCSECSGTGFWPKGAIWGDKCKPGSTSVSQQSESGRLSFCIVVTVDA